MKKHILEKVFAALIILAVSSYFASVQGQAEVKLEFTNPTGLDYGNPDGIGGRISGERDPLITLQFNVGVAGEVVLDASTISENQDNIDLVNSWDGPKGTTAYADIFGKSFTLILTSNKRLQCGKFDKEGNGGIGCQGTNQRRIDGAGGEKVYFILKGDVGIEFKAIEYRDINYMEGDANFEIWDYDTKEVWYMQDIGNTIGTFDVTGKYSMRYKSDSLSIMTTDTIAGKDNNPGGRLQSLLFNIVAPIAKPPAVISTTPPNGDSLTMEINDDYIIEFDAPMKRTATEAAVTFSPGVTNRTNAWSEGEEGDVLTISFADLPYATWYTVSLDGSAVEGTNDLKMGPNASFRFKTLPEPPGVIATFPENQEEDVPTDSPISITFSKPMIPDSVEKAISFDPPVTGMSFVWSEDNSTVFISTEMAASTMYFVTVSTTAADEFGIHMDAPKIFVFMTSLVTSIEDNNASGAVIYPNPASDILQVRGADVASVKIYSINGQMLKEIRNSVAIDVRDIETGIYIVTVTDTEGNHTRKMMVIK